jgi:hypothetical protein
VKYIVETRFGNTWENVWTDDDIPCVFDSEHEARAEINGLLKEMPDYSERDFRIVEMVL